MAEHQKIDMLTDEAMANHTVAVGDVLTLDVPTGEGKFERGEHTVTKVEIFDGGEHEGVHYNRVILTLEG